MIYKYRILILDFGSQYTHLLARRIREFGVYCEIWTWNITENQIRQFNPNGIILSGGPKSATKLNSPRAPEYVFQALVPVLGICYGMQIMAIQLGGKVQRNVHREFGLAKIKILTNCRLLDSIYNNTFKQSVSILDVWMSHGDIITSIPKDFVKIASTEDCSFAIIANETKCFYGLQFHPEVTHTNQGQYILKSFILDICHCKSIWTSSNIIDNTITCIRKQVGYEKVILGLSGGIDSAVTAMLLHKAIGSNLTCIFINNGLLSFNEKCQVIEFFTNNYGLNIVQISAEKRFLNALAGIVDPEIKRKIIGKLFAKIFHEQAMDVSQATWLAQGTIYSDTIESAVYINGKIHTIKSHHNVGGLPEKMKMKLLEPLKKLFKDEVREIALKLGLPKAIIYSHPFPGPGLSVRILGEVKKEYCALLRQADSIFIEELIKDNLYNKISQAFTVFLPIKSVGIMGDNRNYDWVIALRAVKTKDFMTANWEYLPYDLLNRVSSRIVNEIDGISRVVYDISSKPPATIEWE